MAEETVPAGEKKAKDPGNMKNLLIIFGFSFLATVIIVCTVLLIVFRNNNAAKSGTPAQVESEKPAKEKEIGPLVSLGNEIIVNIPSEDGTPHYLKVTISLEGDSEKAGEELKKRVPQIRDLVITILTSKTIEKIEEKEGKEIIRSEIIKNVNRYMVEGKVRNAFFEDFMLQ